MHVQSLHIYPVKSAGAVTRRFMMTGAFGFAGDRQFMVVSPRTGKFITQRENNKLAALQIEKSMTDAAAIVMKTNDGILAVDGRDHEREERRVSYKHFASDLAGYDCGDQAAQFLSAFLGEEARLIFQGFNFDRRMDSDFTQPDQRVGYADGFQYLITTMASLNALNAALEKAGEREMTMDRFRPNIVIDGDFEPFSEDKWSRISVNGVEFDLVKPCARCVIPSIDQQAGEIDRKPNIGLKQLGRQGRITANKQVGIMFGMNAVCGANEASIHEGAAVKVLERHPTPLWEPLKPKG